MTYDEALAAVREQRSVQPNMGFETQLRGWERSLASASTTLPELDATAEPATRPPATVPATVPAAAPPLQRLASQDAPGRRLAPKEQLCHPAPTSPGEHAPSS